MGTPAPVAKEAVVAQEGAAASDVTTTVVEETAPAEGTAPVEEGSLLSGDLPEAEKPEEKTDEKPEEKVEEVEKDEVPEAYEFVLPEGQELDAGMTDSFKTVAKELGLGQKAAQKLVDMVASHAQKAVEAQKVQEAATVSNWKKEILADPKHAENISNAKLTLQKFSTPEFKALTDGWLGSHPAVVKFLANIGSHLREADFVSDAPAGSSGGKDSLGAVLYPNMKRKK